MQNATAQTCQFTLRVAAVDGDLGGPEAVEEFALDLRTRLSDLDVTRIDQLPAGEAPHGSRGAEILEVANFVLAAVQTTATIPKVIEAVRQVWGEILPARPAGEGDCGRSRS